MEAKRDLSARALEAGRRTHAATWAGRSEALARGARLDRMFRAIRARVAGTAGLAVVTLALSPAGSAQAAEGGPQRDAPVSLAPEALAAWTRDVAGIAPAQVVAVSPQGLLAVLDRSPERDGRFRVGLRVETLDPALAEAEHAMSWTGQAEFDCPRRQIRLGPAKGFSERNLKGAPAASVAAERAWRSPAAGSALEAAWRAVCTPEFRGPLAPRTEVAATAPPIATARAPATGPPAVAAEREAEATAAAAPALRSRPEPATGRFSLQLASVPSPDEARQVAARLGARFSALFAADRIAIAPARVRDASTYRVLVTGFPSLAAAQAACRQLKDAAQACMVRGPSPGPAPAGGRP